MSYIESIVVVGPSGAGKSSLVDVVRTPEYEDSVVVPSRYVTRPPRENDNMAENAHVGTIQFAEGVQQGIITPHWARPMEEGRWERYGFDIIDDDDDRLPVYSANNAFLRHPNQSTKKILENGLVVLVTAGTAARARRLRQRSPDLQNGELDVRLRDTGNDLPKLHDPTEIIRTTKMTLEEGQLAFRSIVERYL